MASGSVVQIFLDNLKIVASSPYALIGYLALLFSWVYIGVKNYRLKITRGLLSKLPSRDRLEILKKEYNISPRAGLSAEQWIRSQRNGFLFKGFIVLILACLILFIAALSRPKLLTHQELQKLNVNTLTANINSGTIFQGVEAETISVTNNSNVFNKSENDSSLKFEIYINGSIKPVTQNEIINIRNERKIQIRVLNVGKVSAENVSLSIHFPLRPDQINFGLWQRQAPPINGKTKQEIAGLLHLWSVSAGSVSEQTWFRPAPITISKAIPSPSFTRRTMEQLGINFSGQSENCPQDFVFHVLPFFISVHSDHSRNFEFLIFLEY